MSTKIHLAADERGRPLRLLLTAGQVNDVTQAPALLHGFRPRWVLADKGYDSRALVAAIESLGAQAVIPPRRCQRPRPFDARRYRMRNAIERCFGRLKQWRRLATRYDRKACHFMAFLCLAAFLIWNP
ncbi:IS4 family transposase [Crenobacter luteus]|nr:IS4 family transposase [Crenobacter luteus]